jgi:hypothetical protein
MPIDGLSSKPQVDRTNDVDSSQDVQETKKTGHKKETRNTAENAPQGSGTSSGGAMMHCQAATDPTTQQGWTAAQKEAEKQKILAGDPQYQELNTDLGVLDDETISLAQRAEREMGGFMGIGKDDNILSREDVANAIKSNTFSPAEKAKLQKLLDNPRVWEQLKSMAGPNAKGLGMLSISTFNELASQKKAQKAEKEQSAQTAAEAKAPKPAPPPPPVVVAPPPPPPPPVTVAPLPPPPPQTLTPPPPPPPVMVAPPPPKPDVEGEIKKKLDADPQYQGTSKQLDLLDKSLDAFTFTEAHYGGFIGGTNDGKLDKGNIEAALKHDPIELGGSKMPPEMREALRAVWNNPELKAKILAMMDAKGGLITLQDLIQMRDGLRKAKTDTESQVRAGVTGQQPPTQSAPPTSGTGDTKRPPSDWKEPDIKPFPPSKQPGTGGAIENLSNATTALQGQIDSMANELAEAMSANPRDEAKIQKLNTAIAKAQQSLQMLVNLQKSLMEMLSNLTKMWSDIAKTAINNMR